MMILPMAQNDYTKEHREATQALLKGFVSNIVEGVAGSRALSEAEVSFMPLLAAISNA